MAKNFKITAKENGNEYWISRAVAVVGVVIGVKNGNISSFLVSQRGPGCPDFIGSWACTCGYLDWDETAEEGVVRELYEELGINVPISKVNLWKVITDPKRDSRQNVILRFVIPIEQDKLDEMVEISKKAIINSESRGGESDEVSDIKLISVTDIPNYTWAFNHDDVILEAYNDWKSFSFGRVTETLSKIIMNK
jgi:ADP-ribose pyrophosphatase YjhB (NUDIX family)